MANGDPGHSRVAIILAVGIATAVNIIVIAVLYDAIFSAGPGLSDNATQILTGAFGGIIGVLGSYIGYRAGAAQSTDGVKAAAVTGGGVDGGAHPVEGDERVPPGGGGVGVAE